MRRTPHTHTHGTHKDDKKLLLRFSKLQNKTFLPLDRLPVPQHRFDLLHHSRKSSGCNCILTTASHLVTCFQYGFRLSRVFTHVFTSVGEICLLWFGCRKFVWADLGSQKLATYENSFPDDAVSTRMFVVVP